jgi:CubicO group peptidase (beta-lactamase class C family)
MRQILAVGFAGVVLSQNGHGQAAAQQQFALEEAGSVLQNAVANGDVGSAVGLIAQGDQILVLSAVGDIEPGKPMPLNAIARLASIQKPITAAAILILHERGQLDLGEPVTKWFPDFGARVLTADGDTVAALRRPTVFDLLTHQAGLVPEGPELDELWEVPATQEFARRIGQIPLRFHPGSKFEYGCCGSAYEVLAAIVEQVSGQSFKDFLASNVLGPLGMTDTYFFVPEPKRHRLAAQYGRDRDGRLVVVRPRGQEAPENAFYSGGGGLRSTVLDFYRFVLMLLNGGELDGVRLLKPETVRMMTTNQAGSSYPTSGYGWGFGVRVKTDTATSGAGRGAFGWNGGTGTQFEVDPESGMIAIIFVPTRPGTPGVSDLRTEFISKGIAAARR